MEALCIRGGCDDPNERERRKVAKKAEACSGTGADAAFSESHRTDAPPSYAEATVTPSPAPSPASSNAVVPSASSARSTNPAPDIVCAIYRDFKAAREQERPRLEALLRNFPEWMKDPGLSLMRQILALPYLTSTGIAPLNNAVARDPFLGPLFTMAGVEVWF